MNVLNCWRQLELKARHHRLPKECHKKVSTLNEKASRKEWRPSPPSLNKNKRRRSKQMTITNEHSTERIFLNIRRATSYHAILFFSISFCQFFLLTSDRILQAFDNRGFPTTIGTDDNCKWKAKFDYLFISIRAEGSDSSDG